MGQAIQSGSGQTFAAQHFGPVFEGQVRGISDAVPFVRGADRIEQKFGTNLTGWHVPQFIKNQQVEFRKLSFQSQQYSFFSGFHQLCDQFRDPVEPNASAPTTGSDRQCDFDVVDVKKINRRQSSFAIRPYPQKTIEISVELRSKTGSSGRGKAACGR